MVYIIIELCVCVCLFRGYLLRFNKMGKKPGDTVYLIDGQWFRQWKRVTGYEVYIMSSLMATYYCK